MERDDLAVAPGAAISNDITYEIGSREAETPINRLHPELLAQIFFELVILWAHSLKDRYISLYRFHWITVLHVCHAWRQIAFETPRLWTTFKFTYKQPEVVAQHVRLSGILPLDIYECHYTPTTETTIASFNLLLDQMARIRTLRFQNSSYAEEVLRHPRWRDLQAPMLEELRLSFMGRGRTESWQPFSSMLLPKLRLLSVKSGSPLAVQQLARATVTHLHLFLLPELSLSQLLAVVRGLPALVSLNVDGVCDNEQNDTTRPPPEMAPIHDLRSLADLSIRTSTPYTASLILHYLHIPAHTNVRLYSHDVLGPNDATTTIQRICERVPVFLPASSAPRPQLSSLRLHCMRFKWSSGPPSDRIQFAVRTWTQDVSETQLRTNWSPKDAKFDFEMYIPRPMFTLDTFFDRLLIQAGVGEITAVCIMSNAYVIDPPSWTALFTAMPKLRFLCLEGRATRTFVRNHESIARSLSTNADAPLLYPSLRHLKLSGTVFADSPYSPRAGDILPGLITALTSQRLGGRGLRLDRLELEYPINLGDDGLEKLRGVQCAEVVDISAAGIYRCGEDDSNFGRSEDEGEDDDADDDFHAL